MGKRIAIAVGLLLVVVLVGGYALIQLAGRGVFGHHEEVGTPVDRARPAALVQQRVGAVAAAAEGVGVPEPKQVLFGDFHVHTTISFDAFMTSLPLLGGEGAHPPADACDFARFCSALDFWSINDHSEQITPQHWRETIGAIRDCNAVAGGGPNPDLVSFLGWEWTQVGQTPAEHYGHKNVVLKDLDDAHIPARPIAAGGVVRLARAATPRSFGLGVLALGSGDPRANDLARYFAERRSVPICDPDVDVHELPTDCIETADTPADLFRKLDQWGFPSIVIPHGTTWGFYTPPGSSWAKQLVGKMNDPKRQTLIEVYSGHGDSDRWRPFHELVWDATDGRYVCPVPTPEYLPTCWQAGEIIRKRCLAAGEEPQECENRAEVARQTAADAGQQAHLTVPGATLEDWLDAGQCRDCDEPAFNYRPGGSVQYILAQSNFAEAGERPRRFELGFIASSDNHSARPGTGYKEYARTSNTESRTANVGQRDSSLLRNAMFPPRGKPEPFSRPFDRDQSGLAGFQLFELERQASFFTTGGLVAVHAEGRDRQAIWDALQRKEVYGTSGRHTLLWFELLNPPGSSGATLPMGSHTEMGTTPIFQARAVGSFVQKPGCPESSVDALGPAEIEHLCKGECYNPSDQRNPITRIEVVRIRPQSRPGEDLAGLIDDPWRTFTCQPDPAGCVVTFDDPDFFRDGRDSLYYVRAFEPAAPAINAGNLRCDRDEKGECIQVHPCPGPEGAADDCLAPYENRAWSSPIYVDHTAAGANVARAE